MNGEAKIKLSGVENALILPVEAVFEENNEKFVYLKKGKKVQKMVVQIGLENDEQVEIKNGLNENDSIVF